LLAGGTYPDYSF